MQWISEIWTRLIVQAARRHSGWGVAALCCLAWAGTGRAQQAYPAVQSPLRVTIETQQTAEPVSKYEYGMFIEHIGALVYRTLWSEMLDDRKFYFPITAAAKKTGAPLPGPFRNMMPRHWHPIGPQEDVTLDAKDPFVGAHSPRIALQASTAHGIEQSGLSLVKGKQYVGYIYLRGTPGTKTKVVLSWGHGTADRQVVNLHVLTLAYKKFPFRFTAGAGTSDAVFSISGTGSGSFHVGTVSLMPADNVDGFRPDTIALLRQLHSGFWRLPGGNFLSDWSWYYGAGPRDKRPPTFDYAWNAMQPNDVGMDEFMTLCKLIGTTPYVTVNAGFGGAHSAAQEVQYLNGSVNTPMGAWRARNGHPAPYGVKFWDIGNEPYGQWQLGRTDLKYYVLKHNEFAAAMRKADPSITLLASAATPDEMIIEGVAQADHVKDSQATLCSKVDWTCGFLKSSWGNFSGITEHWYARAGYRFDMAKAESGAKLPHLEAGYVPAHYSVLEWVRDPSNRVHIKAEEWKAYEKLFPQMAKKHIFMSIDEYAYTGAAPNLKSAMAYAMVFNEMLRHTDFIRMSAFTMGVSTLNITPTNASMNTTGLLFKLYGEHMGAGMIPVKLNGNAPQPLPTQHIVGDLPKTNAGSPTYPLDMVAALSPDHKYLNIAVVNATEKDQKFAMNIAGMRVVGAATLWQMTGKDLGAANDLGKSPGVKIHQLSLHNVGGSISVAPISINIYHFPVEEAQ
jgi:alpha-N-arabinofuranosidase